MKIYTLSQYVPQVINSEAIAGNIRFHDAMLLYLVLLKYIIY